MLHSADNRFTFQLLLSRALGKPHSGWLSYTLVLCAHERDEYRFASTDDSRLFLNCEIDPEVPALCSALRSVAVGGGTYCFEPIDERDFSFHVVVEGDLSVVKLEIPDRPIPESTGWASGVAVGVAELLRFADELESQYQTIMQ